MARKYGSRGKRGGSGGVRYTSRKRSSAGAGGRKYAARGNSGGARGQTLRIVLQQAPQTGAGGLVQVPGMMPRTNLPVPPGRKF